MTPDKPLSLTWTPSLLKRTAASLAVHAGQMRRADVGGRWGHYGCSPGNLLASAIHITREPVELTGPTLTEEACNWLVMPSVNRPLLWKMVQKSNCLQPSLTHQPKVWLLMTTGLYSFIIIIKIIIINIYIYIIIIFYIYRNTYIIDTYIYTYIYTYTYIYIFLSATYISSMHLHSHLSCTFCAIYVAHFTTPKVLYIPWVCVHVLLNPPPPQPFKELTKNRMY